MTKSILILMLKRNDVKIIVWLPDVAPVYLHYTKFYKHKLE